MTRLPDPDSGWQLDDPADPAQPALTGDTSATVVVVGGGLAGLALAHALIRSVPARELLLLEAGRIGGGATGHSTGIVGPGVGGPVAGQLRRYGVGPARRMFAASLLGVAALRRLAESLPHGCELADSDQLVTAAVPAHAARLREQAGILRDDFGFDVGYLDRAVVARRLGTSRQYGALCYPNVALVNPWRLAQALRRALLDAGVRIHEDTPVTGVVGGDPVTLVAGGHRVRAGQVVLAVDGYAPALGVLPGRIAPVRTHVLRTGPVPADLLAATGWDGRTAAIDSRNFFNYFRLTTGDRLLFGGGPVLHDDRVRPRGVAAVQARLRRELAGTFPTLADLPVTDFWSGVTASTFDRLPIVGPVPDQPGVWHLGAWCGHGLAHSVLAAQLLPAYLTGGQPWSDRDRELVWLRGSAGLMPSGRSGAALLAGYLRALDATDRLAGVVPRSRPT